jgi:hypothetical protein
MQEVVSLSVVNSTNGTVPISILGNNADTMDTSNATTQYQWNLTGFTITNEKTIIIQYGTNGIANTIAQLSFNGTTIQSICDILNTLNFGYFFITTSGGSIFINNYNNNVAFGTLQILNTSQPASLSYSFNLNLPQDQADIYVNAVLINSFTDPTLASGTVSVVAGDSVTLDVLTSNNPKGTNVFVYNITTGVYLFNTTQLNSGNTGYTWTILANNSYLIGMND